MIGSKTGTDPTSGQFRLIHLADANHPIYLPSGVYKLTGAPGHPDRRAYYYGYYWGIRVYFPVPQNMAFTTFGYPNSSGSGAVSARSVVETDEVKRVWDREYGAIFTLEKGSWMHADIYVSAKPVSDSEPYANECPTEDIWKPSLVRIGDAPSNRGTRAPLPENA